VSLLDVETPAQPISIAVATRLKTRNRAFIIPPSYKVRVEQTGIHHIHQILVTGITEHMFFVI
jgi:hypothetical protein